MRRAFLYLNLIRLATILPRDSYTERTKTDELLTKKAS